MFTKIKLFFKSLFSKSTSAVKKAFTTAEEIVAFIKTSVEKGDIATAKIQVMALVSAVKVIAEFVPGKSSDALTLAATKLSDAINSNKIEDVLSIIGEVNNAISAIKIII